MTLQDIRVLFVQHSGRYDLVKDTTEYDDNGADFFIREGQRFLDQELDTPKSKGIRNYTLDKEENLIKVPECRVIQDVHLIKDDGDTHYLTKIPYSDYKIKYGGQEDPALPLSYAEATLVSNRPNQGAIRYNGIYVAPKPNNTYEFFVEGKFYSYPLKDNDDYSFWSVDHPMTLLQAALYSLERLYRNTQGMQDHLIAITRDITKIDHDKVEQDIQGVTKMSDSFNESDYKLKHKRG